jgi:hypothetical protein
MPDPIQGMWVGSRLSTLELACIKSYLDHGHPFHLYVYDNFVEVPETVEVRDANTIVPRSEIERFQNLANFSDYFRYKMLYLNGGYWVDLDNYCLKTYDFADPYVFSSQLVEEKTDDELNAGVIKVPARSELMRRCLVKVNGMNVKETTWAQLGPQTLLETVQELNLHSYRRTHLSFCPLHYFDAPGNIINSGTERTRFCGATYSVHLWNEELRRAGINKDADYPGSLYNRLRASWIM